MVGRDVSLQTHLFEDRVMKMSTVRSAAGATVGDRADRALRRRRRRGRGTGSAVAGDEGRAAARPAPLARHSGRGGRGVTRPSHCSVELLDLDATDPVDDATALPTEDLAVAGHITDERRRRWFLAGRRKVRLRLASILGVPPAQVPLQRGRNGKPEVAGAPVHFSVAARDAACVLATSLTHPVGVQIAPVPDRTPVPVLRQILPATASSAVLAAEPDRQPQEFALWWCRVEAAVRAFGAGLDEAAACLATAPQEARSVGPDLVAAVALASRRAPLDAVHWRLGPLTGTTP